MDLRRSVLWVVFTMSMIFLYNSWLRYNGETDLFGVMTQNTDPRALTFGRRLISVEEQLTKYWSCERTGLRPTRSIRMEGHLRLVQVQAAHAGGSCPPRGF
jgi:YidC/Oxa1 family membrane protein insertase